MKNQVHKYGNKRSYLEEVFDDTISRYHLPQPIREFPFYKWRFDYAWPQIKIAVEIQGGTYNGGHHVTGKVYENDCWKKAQAQLEGWVVLEADRNMANTYKFAVIVKRMINRRLSCLKSKG